jgi:cytochrome c553
MKPVQLRRIGVISSISMLAMALAVPMAVPQKTPSQKTTAKVAATPSSGATLFAKQCAPCHGDKGVGGGGYPKALTGTKSLNDLGSYIAKSMPPGAKKTPPAQATEIARYMHDAFYSPVAQERFRPARVEMARLTVRQFRNALSDLFSTLYNTIEGEPGGLNGSYFKAHSMDDANRLIRRVDSEVSFDFGVKAPGDKPFDLYNFSISWDGGIIAPESGVYDFILRTDQAATVSINDLTKPLLDGRVRSANEKEFRGSVFLIGGRAYPISVTFTKTTTGVNDDEKKKKIPPGPASIQLSWKRPKMTEEIIPSQYLIPKWHPTSYICQTTFPADDRSIGYERGTAMSKEWDEATTNAAIEAANYASRNFEQLFNVKRDAADAATKLKQAAKVFVSKAFRQPLSTEQEQLYIEKQFAATKDLGVAIKRVVLLALKSPRFLYREIGNRKDSYQLAAELSFGLWDTVPDQELLRAASAGELKTPDGVRRQAQRMVNSPRSYAKLRDFLMVWLKVDENPDIIKNTKSFPNFDNATVADLRTSLDLYLKDATWGQDGSFQNLMLSQNQFLNSRLAGVYGASVPAGAGFQKVASPDRAGVLTHPYLLSRFAYLEGSSPIHRGVLIIRSMMGRVLSPPPVAVAPVAPSLHPTLTTRERVVIQTKPDACNGCHGIINPLGFTLEKYDAIGRLRNTDNNKPVDTTGGYMNQGGNVVKLNNAQELANFIANSEEAQTAFAEKLFQHMTKQPIRAYGKTALPNLHSSFKRDKFSIKSLMVEILMTTITEGNPKQ